MISIAVGSVKKGSGALTVAVALAAAAAATHDHAVLLDIPGRMRTGVHPLGFTVTYPDKDWKPGESNGPPLLTGLDSADVVIIATGTRKAALVAGFDSAFRVVIPVSPDILTLRAASLTVGLAFSSLIEPRLGGLVSNRVKTPPTRVQEALINGLTISRLAYAATLPDSGEFQSLTSKPSALSEAASELARALLDEVLTRPAGGPQWRQFTTMAGGPPDSRGSGGAGATVPRVPFPFGPSTGAEASAE